MELLDRIASHFSRDMIPLKCIRMGIPVIIFENSRDLVHQKLCDSDPINVCHPSQVL